MTSKEILNISPAHAANFQYSSETGAFFIYNQNNGAVGSIRNCREEFAGYFGNSTRFVGFSFRNTNIKLLNEFFKTIEKKISKKQTVFYATNVKGVIICEPAPFWRISAFRRGLFTLFLRCGAVYYKEDFDEALERYGLTRAVKPMVYRFIAGYTEMRGDTNSPHVVEMFRNKKDAGVDSMLTKQVNVPSILGVSFVGI